MFLAQARQASPRRVTNCRLAEGPTRMPRRRQRHRYEYGTRWQAAIYNAAVIVGRGALCGRVPSSRRQWYVERKRPSSPCWQVRQQRASVADIPTENRQCAVPARQ